MKFKVVDKFGGVDGGVEIPTLRPRGVGNPTTTDGGGGAADAVSGLEPDLRVDGDPTGGGGGGASASKMKDVDQDLEQPSSGGLASESKMKDVPLGDGDKAADDSELKVDDDVKEEKGLKKGSPCGKALCLVGTGLVGIFAAAVIAVHAFDAGPTASPAPSSEPIVLFNSSTMGGKDEVFGADTSARDKESRISGGFDASPNQFPYYVLLDGCGGSLIAPNVVLTAAHCTGNLNTYVSVGAYGRRENDSPGVTVRVIEEIDHHQYNWPQMRSHDLKLLRLAHDVTIESSIATLSLDSTFGYTHPETALTVVGLGLTEDQGRGEDPNLADILQYTEVYQLSDSYCDQVVDFLGGTFDSSSMFCAGTNDGGKGSCRGDSGGPIVEKRGNQHVQVGVVSFGAVDNCSEQMFPGFYAKVGTEFNWIWNTVCVGWNARASFCSHIPAPPPQLRNTWRFLIEPVGGSARCDGKVRLSFRTDPLGIGSDIKANQKGCNAYTEGGRPVYEIILASSPDGSWENLVEITYNKHGRSCWKNPRGFYIEGKANPVLSALITPPDRCINLRRMKKSFFKCKNRESYNFNVIGYHKDASGAVSILDINIRDNGAMSSCNRL